MSLHQKLEGATRGGALGDALGLPPEAKTMQEIKLLFGIVDSFLPIKWNKHVSQSIEKGEFQCDPEQGGYISDGTILTLAGLQSLINTKKIDIADLFREHNAFVEKFGTGGFGQGTLDALRKIKNGTPPAQAGGLSRGNGMLMKQLPYAFHFVTAQTQPAEMDETIMRITQATHKTPIAILTAILHNRLLVHPFKQDPNTPIDRDALLSEYLILAQKYEAELRYDSRDKDQWYVSDIIKELIIQRDFVKIGRAYDHQMILDTYTVTGTKLGAKRGFHAASTMGYTRSIFLQNPNREGLLDGIAIGQDTDSQAAIIGNMIGAWKGEFYDKTLIQSLKSKDEIARVLQEVKEVYAL